MKALILAAGKGTRLYPLTDTVPKHLLPIANKPILLHILEQIRGSGIREIGIVVSPDTIGLTEKALEDKPIGDVQITYIVQVEPLGLANAVKTAQDFLANQPFLVFLGDNLIKDSVKRLVNQFSTSHCDAMILLKEVGDPRRFGVAELDSSGKILRLVEKPKEPKSNLALVGVYLFTPEIHQAIARIKPSPRGEFEITDAIQELLKMGGKVISYVITGWWYDVGQQEGLIEANRVVLSRRLRRDIKGKVDAKSLVFGRVRIGLGSTVKNSVILGPVSIAEYCLIDNSYINRFSSIGAGTTIENSSVSNVIVMEKACISGAEINGKIIIKNAEITGRSKTKKIEFIDN